MLDKSSNVKAVSDAELDALLAEWADGEIEPPAGFHEETMKRLRAEAQPKKKNNVIQLFAKNRRWTSVAAAAVLVLFCVPVVQGQLGGNAADTLTGDQQPVQMVRSVEDNANVQNENIEEKQQSRNTQAGKKTAEMVKTTAAMNVADENDGIAVAQNIEDESQPLATAAFNPEEETGVAAFSIERQSGETYLDSLQQELQDAETQLLEYEAKLNENPDDSQLQELVKQYRDMVAELKQEIETMKQTLENTQAE